MIGMSDMAKTRVGMVNDMANNKVMEHNPLQVGSQYEVAVTSGSAPNNFYVILECERSSLIQLDFMFSSEFTRNPFTPIEPNASIDVGSEFLYLMEDTKWRRARCMGHRKESNGSWGCITWLMDLGTHVMANRALCYVLPACSMHMRIPALSLPCSLPGFTTHIDEQMKQAFKRTVKDRKFILQVTAVSDRKHEGHLFDPVEQCFVSEKLRQGISAEDVLVEAAPSTADYIRQNVLKGTMRYRGDSNAGHSLNVHAADFVPPPPGFPARSGPLTANEQLQDVGLVSARTYTPLYSGVAPEMLLPYSPGTALPPFVPPPQPPFVPPPQPPLIISSPHWEVGKKIGKVQLGFVESPDKVFVQDSHVLNCIHTELSRVMSINTRRVVLSRPICKGTVCVVRVSSIDIPAEQWYRAEVCEDDDCRENMLVLLLDWGRDITVNRSDAFYFPNHTSLKCPSAGLMCAIGGVYPPIPPHVQWPSQTIAFMNDLRRNKNLSATIGAYDPQVRLQLVTLCTERGENIADVMHQHGLVFIEDVTVTESEKVAVFNEVTSRTVPLSFTFPPYPLDITQPMKDVIVRADMRVSHCFYVLPSDNKSVDMQTYLVGLYGRHANQVNGLQLPNVQPGTACVIPNEHINTFSRGVVQAIDRHFIQVLLVDEGFIASVPVGTAFACLNDAYVTETPAQAIPCKLLNMEYIGEPREIHQLLQSYLTRSVSHVLFDHVSESGDPEIVVQCRDGSFLDDLLISVGLARRIDSNQFAYGLFTYTRRTDTHPTPSLNQFHISILVSSILACSSLSLFSSCFGAPNVLRVV